MRRLVLRLHFTPISYLYLSLKGWHGSSYLSLSLDSGDSICSEEDLCQCSFLRGSQGSTNYLKFLRELLSKKGQLEGVLTMVPIGVVQCFRARHHYKILITFPSPAL